jgi:HSP20 family protein
MAITRYAYRNPWRELDQLTNRLSQLFDESGYPMPSSSGSWMPAVSVEETENELILTAELPGVSPDDVDVQLENNILTIRGTKTEERREDDANRRFHVWERSYGSFARSFTLPRTVRAEDITADFRDGLLRITMPKSAESKSRRIEVGRGSKNELGAGGAARMGAGNAGEQRTSDGGQARNVAGSESRSESRETRAKK